MPRKVGNVLLNVNGCHYQADRYLLTSQSFYFRTLLSNKTKRDKYGAITIPGDGERFGLIIDYLTGEHHLTIDELESIINDGASLYLIPSLMYLSQIKTKYEARDKERIRQIKKAMDKIDKLKIEITKLESNMDHMRQTNKY